MKLLLLGGTADARKLCALLHSQYPDAELVYSVAGLVRIPQVPAQIISGGFRQYGGLAKYCNAQSIDAIVDATHPFATVMSTHARATAHNLGMPYWRFLRPAWEPQTDDQWHTFSDRQALLQAMQKHQRVLLTMGQVTSEELSLLNQVSNVWLRTAVEPHCELPQQVTWIKAIGPFALADEQKLLQQHQIQALACKNSGGDATSAKLIAARELQLPVYMLQRPPIDGSAYAHFDQLLSQLNEWHKRWKAHPGF
jgi:precorrin-6A/cobalt-precorrin-6A reductase